MATVSTPAFFKKSARLRRSAVQVPKRRTGPGSWSRPWGAWGREPCGAGTQGGVAWRRGMSASIRRNAQATARSGAIAASKKGAKGQQQGWQQRQREREAAGKGNLPNEIEAGRRQPADSVISAEAAGSPNPDWN